MITAARWIRLAVDLLGMISIVLVCIVLFIIPIINTVNYEMEASPLFIEMVGPDPRRCAFAILILGYTFDVTLIGLVLASIFCHALDFRVTFFIGWGTLVLGFSAIISTCVFLGFVNPTVCVDYERKLGYALYANQTSDAFRRWLRDARCLEFAECVVYAHQFVTDTCEKYFHENLALGTSGMALLIVGIVGTAFMQSREEEEEDLADDQD
jgi:hypothetical protein